MVTGVSYHCIWGQFLYMVKIIDSNELHIAGVVTYNRGQLEYKNQTEKQSGESHLIQIKILLLQGLLQWRLMSVCSITSSRSGVKW